MELVLLHNKDVAQSSKALIIVEPGNGQALIIVEPGNSPVKANIDRDIFSPFIHAFTTARIYWLFEFTG